jgi:hypothetical protein
VLTFRGHTPALKNNKLPTIRKGKDGNNQIVPITAKAVRIWMRESGDDAERQWQQQQELQGFSTILMPQRVRCVTYVHFFASSLDVIPVSDLDNAYSTIQELLQLPGKPGGRLGVIEDDKQVFSHANRKRITRNRKTQHAIIYLWVDDGREEWEQESEFEKQREVITNRTYDFGSSLPELLS